MNNVVFENTPKVSVSEFIDELAYEFTDAPYGLLEHCVKRVVSRICEHTNVLRRRVKLHTQCNVHNYILEAPDCMDVIAVMSICQCCGNALCSKLVRVTSPVCELHCFGPNTVHIEHNEIVFSAPSCATYIVEISVKPQHDACEVDSVLLVDHADTVVDGVRAMLCNMADKPWSSVQRAQASEQSFIRGCAAIAVDKLLGNQRGVMNVKRQRVF